MGCMVYISMGVFDSFPTYLGLNGVRGGVVEALCYKPEGDGFDS
jgi:hypothetical protein